MSDHASELRIYTLNPGNLDAMKARFDEKVRPLYEKYGVIIEGMWSNPERDEFVWLRTFSGVQSVDDLAAALAHYESTPEVQALRQGGLWGGMVQHMEVRRLAPIPTT